MSKKRPPPSASHLDNPEGGVAEIQLLQGRIKTLEKHGQEAMSEIDLRLGYKPDGIIRLLHGQIQHLKNQMEPKQGNDMSEGRDASHENLSRGVDEEKLAETKERITAKEKGDTGFAHLPEDRGEGVDGAAKLFEQTSDIRRAIALLRSEQRETRKRYKKAITTLELAQDGIYDSFEDKQLRLFDEEPELSDEVTGLIEHPSLM